MENTVAEDNSDLSLAVGEVRAGVRHILASMDQMRDNIREMHVEFKRETTELSKRITDVERFMWRAAGAGALVSIFVPAGVTILLRFFGG